MKNMIKVEEMVYNKEQDNFEKGNKLPKFKNQNLYPIYNLPSDRDFERLLFFLFKNKPIEINTAYDDIWLMQGIKEKGRDIALRKEGENIGLIQCKLYKNKLDAGQVGREIIKFILFSIKDAELIYGDSFYYYLATAHGINDTAKTLLDNVNRNKFDDIKDKVRDWSIALINNKDLSFKDLVFKDIEQLIYDNLRKINVIDISDEFISELIDKDINTRDKFFQIDKVIDEATFNDILSKREEAHLKEYKTLSSLEKELEKLEPGLFDDFIKIKEKAIDLMNNFGINFMYYSNHKRDHSFIMSKVIFSIIGPNHGLNVDEIFVLLSSSYLTDIGICQIEDDIMENHSQLLTVDKIRDNHSLISSEFIRSKGDQLLSIPEKYIDCIALLVEATANILEKESSRKKYPLDYTIESYACNKINLLYLANLIWLADIIDIEDLNSTTLLNKYTDYPNYTTSVCLWDEIDYLWKNERNENRFIYTTKKSIDDQLIFLGLSNAIERVRLVLDKINLILIKQDRKVNLSFIDCKLLSRFERKIGITLDAYNIRSNLLGKRLYDGEEKYAIRELIQNAIDACYVKEKVTKDYNPRIDIEFNQNNLIVSDNGIGMNEETIKEYFSKVGRSYHVEYQNNKAIGEFGIGVQSYFMLKDSFIVETIYGNEAALKFKVDDKTPDLFYFYESCEIESGTRITFNELDYQTSEAEIKEFIQFTFKMSSIPIYLNGDKINEVEVLDFNDQEKFIEKYVKIEHRDNFYKHFQLIFVQLNNEILNGWIGAFLPKGNITELDIRRKVEEKSGSKIYNKGVFVCSGQLIGEINIKEGLPLKLNRNNFENVSDIDDIFDSIGAKLYEEIFTNRISPSPWYTLFYLVNYGGGHKVLSKFYNNDRIIYPLLFLKGNMFFKSLYEIIESSNEVELGIYKEISIDEISNRSKESSSFLIPVTFIYTDKFYLQYFISRGYNLSIKNYTRFSNILLSRNIHKCQEEIKIVNNREIKFVNFEDNLFSTVFSIVVYFNAKHALSKYYIENKNSPHKKKGIKILVGFFSEVAELLVNAFENLDGKYRETNILSLNFRLEQINKIEKTNFKLLKEDFPLWMRSYLK